VSFWKSQKQEFVAIREFDSYTPYGERNETLADRSGMRTRI
jgi:hypothetical protein